MTFYFCILFVTILLCFIRRAYKVTLIKNCFSVNISHVIFCFVFLCLSFTVGLRYITFGTDTSHYAFGFILIASREFNLDVLFGYSAPVYTLLCNGLSFVSSDNILLRRVSSIITYFCFYKSIKKISCNPLFFLFLLIAFFYFTVAVTNFLFKKFHLINSFFLSVIFAILFNDSYEYILTYISDYFTLYKIYTEGNKFLVFQSEYKSNLFPLYMFYFSCIVLYVLSSFKTKDNQLNRVFLPILSITSVYRILNPFNEIVFRLVFPISFFNGFLYQTFTKTEYTYKNSAFFIFFVGCACYTYSVLREWHRVIPYSIFS